MTNFKKKGDKRKYNFVDHLCIGRKCWSPGMYQHRSPMSCGGSRNTGSPDTPCCMHRAYHGCPEGPVGETTEVDDEGNQCVHVGLPEVETSLVKIRKAEGWRLGS